MKQFKQQFPYPTALSGAITSSAEDRKLVRNVKFEEPTFSNP
jgi:hypothetical protein